MAAAVALVPVTCTNQSRERALRSTVIRDADKLYCEMKIRTWSFVLKQRGLGHQGGK